MKDALETFKKQTGYDIQSFFESFALFANSYYPLIVAYYTGQDDIDIGDSFGRLDTLLKQSREIEPLFTLKATGLARVDSWELLDMFTECQTKLWTIDNSLEYEAAIGQALDTIINSLKGSIPEFPDYGLPNEAIGSSVNAIQYPSLFKHLVNMFQRDARWVEVNLLDLYRKEDAIFMKIQAKTVTNNFLVTNIQI